MNNTRGGLYGGLHLSSGAAIRVQTEENIKPAAPEPTPLAPTSETPAPAAAPAGRLHARLCVFTFLTFSSLMVFESCLCPYTEDSQG